MVGGHDDDKCERHDQSDEHRTNKPHDAATKQPSRYSSEETHNREWGLHRGRPLVARSPDHCSSLNIAAHSCGMLDKINVDCRPRKDGAAEGGDKLRDVKHSDIL